MPVEIGNTMYLSVKEVTLKLKIGRTTVKRWVHEGLPYGLGRLHGVLRERHTGRLLIPLSELKRCRVKGDPKNYEPIEILEAIEIEGGFANGQR